MVCKCEVKECENKAFMLYGTKWICGECFIKLQEKKANKLSKEVDDL